MVPCTAGPVCAGLAPQQKCAVAKVKAVGKRVRGQLGCHGKAIGHGTGVDGACLATVAAKTDAAFAKAEGVGGCLIAGDAGAAGAAADALVESLVAAVPTGGVVDARKCAAGKLAAAGKKTQGLLACAAKALAGANDPACSDAVRAKFAAVFAKLESKLTCASTGDVAAIELLLDDYVAAATIALTSTTTTTTTTSTTTSASTVATTSTTTAPASTTTTTAASGTFTAVQQIFTASCALPQCHVQPFPGQDLELTPGVAYGQLVGVYSGQKSNVKRVKPGDANNSYLYRKVNGSGSYLGARMPNNGLVLTAAEILSIKQWILAGALND